MPSPSNCSSTSPRDAGRLEVMQALHDHLLERHAEGKQVVMFVEESQSMPIATLEEIRLLSNLETAHDKLLQIVLFGQPELDDNLRQPHIRQLRERITHSFRLEPLDADEIREYLMFRLRAAGYRGPDLFSPAMVQAHRAGLRRADAPHQSDRRQGAARRIFRKHAHRSNSSMSKPRCATANSASTKDRRLEPRYAWSAALVLAGAVIGVAIYSLIQHASETPASRRPCIHGSPGPTGAVCSGQAGHAVRERRDCPGSASKPCNRHPPAADRIRLLQKQPVRQTLLHHLRKQR